MTQELSYDLAESMFLLTSSPNVVLSGQSSLFPGFYPSIFPTQINQSIYPSIYLSIYLSIYIASNIKTNLSYFQLYCLLDYHRGNYFIHSSIPSLCPSSSSLIFVLIAMQSKSLGLANRLESELRHLLQDNVQFNRPSIGLPKRFVLSQPAAKGCAAWVGGSIVGSLSSALSLFIDRKEYEEQGAYMIHSRCNNIPHEQPWDPYSIRSLLSFYRNHIIINSIRYAIVSSKLPPSVNSAIHSLYVTYEMESPSNSTVKFYDETNNSSSNNSNNSTTPSVLNTNTPSRPPAFTASSPRRKKGFTLRRVFSKDDGVVEANSNNNNSNNNTPIQTGVASIDELFR